MKDFSCRFGDGLKTNRGNKLRTSVMAPKTTLDGAELNFGDLDGFLDEVDEVDGIDATNGLSSPCDDYLLDMEFTEQVSDLDYSPREGSHLGNLSSESHSPGFSGVSGGAVFMLESATEFIPERECKNKRVICELHGTFRSKCSCQTSLKYLDYLQNDPKLLGSGVSLSSVEASKTGTLHRHERMRKRTLRYIEESSDPKSQYFNERHNISTTHSKDKLLRAGSCNEHREKRVKEWTVVKAEESPGGASVRTPFESCVRRGRPKKQRLQTESEDSSSTESEDDFVTAKRSIKSGGDRRKHQRMWTLSEVTNLVDGISQFGVGRWTEIKRILFSSSTYRTPIDLRDKWRNLLRASCAHKQNRRQVEPRQNHAPLPKSILRRISELANIHPYPKEKTLTC